MILSISRELNFGLPQQDKSVQFPKSAATPASPALDKLMIRSSNSFKILPVD